MTAKSVLFLDDETQYIEGLKPFFESFGYRVVAEDAPARALREVEVSRPEVVFFDFKMPEMEGDAFFKKAKALNPAARYYLVTAYRNDATVDYFKGLGVEDVLMKPVDLEQILRILRAVPGT